MHHKLLPDILSP